MNRQMIRWALTLALLVAVGSPAWAQTISFRKLTSGDQGEAGFTDIIQDTIVARGLDDGDPDGASDVARMNNGGRGGDTLGAFGGRYWAALMKWNPDAISTDGSNTPMPAPGTPINSATLRLYWLGEGLGSEASDMVIAALRNDDPSSVIDENTWFGNQNEEYQDGGIGAGLTAENGFNNGVCGPLAVDCGPKDQRDFFSNAADTTHINLQTLPLTSNELYPDIAPTDHDVTALWNSGALTGLGVFIGRIGFNQGEGTNLRLSDDANIGLRPMLIIDIPEPASVALLALGGLVLMARRRR